MHTPSTAINSVRNELSCAFCEALAGPAADRSRRRCYVRRTGAFRPLRTASYRLTSPGEEELPRPRDRRRSRAILAAHPRRAADRRVGRHVAALPRGARAYDGSTAARWSSTAPDESRAWITDRFSRLLQAAAGRVLGSATAVQLVAPDAAPASSARARNVGGRRRPVQPALHVRPVRDRRLQPARPRRRARGRRDAGARLQPAVHLRPARARQDAPAALDRQLRRGLRRRADASATRRSRRSPTTSSARSTTTASTPSRPPTATSTSCSSTTSSSSRARRRPRRSSSTRSTRCTRPAPSSC